MVSPPSLWISQSLLQLQKRLPIASPALRAFLSRLSSSIRHGFSQRRPWLELVDGSSISRPETLSEALSRIRKNLSYFQINYITLIASVLAIFLISHPFSFLLLLCLLAAWLFLYTFRSSDQPLVIFARTFSNRETLAVLVVSTILVIFLTSIGSIIIYGLLVGFAIVCFHGAFRLPEDLFINDQEPVNPTGFISLLDAATPSGTARVMVL
ncbi:PRA1 family protein B3-like [Impatiens glandulifera]|uniref:PRA1 family protein B3-like n=1 Tax=Impatiens glandulifera TaxID=253017 RepID=UPI001FB0D62A|nr:PRA1 family protein B3-like [Impatiens glandulifera]